MLWLLAKFKLYLKPSFGKDALHAVQNQNKL